MEKINISQIDDNGLNKKINELLSPVAKSNKWIDLDGKALSLYSMGGDSSYLNGYSDKDFIKTNTKTEIINNNLTVRDIYVDTVNGEDNIVNGSSVTPYKTIMYAINSLPKFLNEQIKINIICNSDNVEINENLIIQGFMGTGSIILESLQNYSDFPSYTDTKNKLIINLKGLHYISFNNLCGGIQINKFRLTPVNGSVEIKNNICQITMSYIYLLNQSSIVQFKLLNNNFVSIGDSYMEGCKSSQIYVENCSCVALRNFKLGFCEIGITKLNSNVLTTNLIEEEVKKMWG